MPLPRLCFLIACLLICLKLHLPLQALAQEPAAQVPVKHDHDHDHSHDQGHDHEHEHDHDHDHEPGIEVTDTLRRVFLLGYGEIGNVFRPQGSLLDTLLENFQLYRHFGKHNPLEVHKGNIGHAMRPLAFDAGSSELFRLNEVDPYGVHRMRHDEHLFYRPGWVFTDLFFVSGRHREQLFSVIHAQRLAADLYFNVNYRIVNSVGLYTRMGARNSNVSLSLDYTHPGRRYTALAAMQINNINNQESGGLLNPVFFEENPERDSVYLYQATARFRETAFTADQFLDLSLGEHISLGRLHHRIHLRQEARVLNDRAAPWPWYDYESPNAFSTYDSARVEVMENRLAWTSRGTVSGAERSFPLAMELGATHRYVRLQFPLFFTEQAAAQSGSFFTHQFGQIEPEIRLYSDPGRRLSFSSRALTALGGFNDRDFLTEARLHWGKETEPHRLGAHFRFARRQAAYFYHRFVSNYISWDNDLEKTGMRQLGLSWRWHIAALASQRPLVSGYKGLNARVDLQADYYRLDRAVYLNENALPQQHPGSFGLWSVKGSLDLGYNWLQSRHHFLLQRSGSKDYEPLAPLAAWHSVYVDFMAFDRALHLQIGFDLNWVVAHHPMGWMPAVRMFYVHDQGMAPARLMGDVFVNFQISRTRFFLKLENIGGVLPDARPVYLIPYYPLPEMAFKFGLSWMFFD